MLTPLLSHNFGLYFSIDEDEQVIALLKGRQPISILSSQATSFNYNGVAGTFFIKFALPVEHLDDFMFYIKLITQFKLVFTARGNTLYSEDFKISKLTTSGTSMEYSDRAPVLYILEGSYK